VAGVLIAALLGEPLERLIFAGDVKQWLHGEIGTSFGAWLMLFVPLSSLAIAASASRWLDPAIMRVAGNWSSERFGAVELLRFAMLVIIAFAIASLVSWLLTVSGFDPRGTYVGTYVQRNALVVGFVMGFAIIPIIYTLADDALHAVPESLRSASLGAGATQWQTAVRVVVPTAMSGLFSAVMIGLGRAVGETMIVLMAAGNTPIMQLNIFNGFETLSAAIATEMPEAVRGSTHFRTLFLAALVLFGLTFIVNTVAELVRLRFRRRVVQL
jgi:phosphate transport system permease protein